MAFGEGREEVRLEDMTAPSIDLSLIADGDDVQLLSRLLRQNKALERLRRALDREDDDTSDEAGLSRRALAG